VQALARGVVANQLSVQSDGSTLLLPVQATGGFFVGMMGMMVMRMCGVNVPFMGGGAHVVGAWFFCVSHRRFSRLI
jgi:hypothetical protein